ncbi:MAG: ferritin family protein [Chloroflexota bacterium]
MSDELEELWDTAIYKEVASGAFYSAAQSKTQDPGAQTLLGELARDEGKHRRWLKKLREEGLPTRRRQLGELPNLKLSDYLTGADTIEGAGLQDTLIFALKREQQALEFYTGMMSLMRDEAAKRLCLRLVNEELRHKLKLELLYDDLFYRED